MESLKEIYNKVVKEIDVLELHEIYDHLTMVGSGQIMEVCEQSEKPNGYYKFIHCYLKTYKPKQVLELGAAAGISTLLMATGCPESKIISVDCDPAAWRWMNREYPNVVKILGDDLDLSIYPNVDLSQTDFWFFDSLHTKKQLQSELNLYKEYFKKGCILTFDDIHINKGMNDVWNELPYEKLDISDRMHWSGWGIARV